MSFRLGGADGVAVEARKWAWALGELGFDVRRVAGAIEDDGRPDDIVLPGLAIDAAGGDAAIDDAAVAAALDGADLVIVDNLCSLPLNVDAAARRRRASRPRTAAACCSATTICPGSAATSPHLGAELPPRVDGALHATINLRSRRELEARGFAGATTIHNFFDLDPAPGDRAATRAAVRLRRRRLRDAATVTRDRAQERARRGAPRRAPRARVARPAGAPVDLGPGRGRLRRHARRASSSAPTVPVTIGRAADVADAYAACDLVVFPSTWEGFGNPVIESIAARRACAAFPYPVLAEILAAGVRCFSTEQPDVLVRFLAEPEARRETYFDVNLRRARMSFSLARSSGRDRAGVRRARMDRVVSDDPVLARRARIARLAALGKRDRLPRARRRDRRLRRGRDHRRSRRGRSSSAPSASSPRA